MEIGLPDGSRQELQEGSSVVELSRKIKKKLQGSALAAKINGETKELDTLLKNGDQVQVLTFADEEGKEIFWHSSAHLLAQAIMRLFPEAKPTIGPAIENGFYYDFANLTISSSDFPRVEEEMKKIAKERLQPQRIEYASRQEALEEFAGNPFKKEMIEQLEEGLSAYRQDEFVDLCRGPHIPHTGLIQSFKITKTSGAYWRADADNEQLTRVYAISFPDKKMLSAHLRFLEEAQKRDHRVLGKQLGLFSFHPEAPGMPFFHPNGIVVWEELMKYWEECHQTAGYQKIKTPIMLTQELWENSGHWDNYRENIYITEIDEKAYAIKPMNCPGGMLYYKENQYSYRQFPMRVGEIGIVHRHELSGALSGLFRVRCFHQDDAHIFMTPEHVPSEIKNVLILAGEMYATFGLEYHLELSTRPEKSIGTDEQWELTTRALEDALRDGGFEYVLNEGDGAFYGPKIDIHIKDAIGRTWQCGTIQLDMMMPERFDLNYIAADGSKQRPIMIHRVIYGSIERFFGVLVEHFAGKFPLWLSPRQVRILAITDVHSQYAEEVHGKFLEAGLRSEVDSSTESVNKKVRQAQLDQVNYILVVGDREVQDGTVTVRAANKVLGARPVQEVIDDLGLEYRSRSPRKTER
ncbi:MAG: threonine--tRNA ligase [Proteobacteria bacterium]|nr:threonine--tRNA ligase [Pseudomonadota bacterium]